MTSKLILFILTITGFFGVMHQEVFLKPEEVEEKNFSMLFLGDIMLGRYVGERILANKDPFLFVHKELMSFDVVIGNLEGPITDSKRCQEKAYSFKFATTTASLLTYHNIQGVSLANNHSYDCFSEGYIDTKKYLAEEDIFFFGGGKLRDSYSQIDNGFGEIFFFGIDQSIGDISIFDFYTQIEEITEEKDFVVVNIHWGNEYETRYSEGQQRVAYGLIDRGVDVIIGHHPHVMQSSEIYKGKPIFYSLGNFIFDQNEDETTKGYAVAMTSVDERVRWEIKPYGIIHTRPAFYNGKVRDELCTRILKDIEERSRCVFDL